MVARRTWYRPAPCGTPRSPCCKEAGVPASALARRRHGLPAGTPLWVSTLSPRHATFPPAPRGPPCSEEEAGSPLGDSSGHFGCRCVRCPHPLPAGGPADGPCHLLSSVSACRRSRPFSFPLGPGPLSGCPGKLRFLSLHAERLGPRVLCPPSKAALTPEGRQELFQTRSRSCEPSAL